MFKKVPDSVLLHPGYITNLRMGCTILKYYLDKEKGDLVKGLARYNGSTGRRVYSDKVLDILRTHWFQR